MSLAGVAGAFAGTWLEDDSIVFGSTETVGRGLSRVSATGGQPSPVASFAEDGEEVRHAYPAAIPGGRGFVSTARSGGSAWVYLHGPGSDEPVLRLVRGRRARVSSSGHLVFELEGTLWAVALDIEQATVMGEPVEVVESFGSVDSGGLDVSAFDLSASGSLAYATAGPVVWPNTELFWVTRDGREEPLDLVPRPYHIVRVSPTGDQIGFHIMDQVNMDFYLHDLGSGVTSRFTFDPAADGYHCGHPTASAWSSGRIVSALPTCSLNLQTARDPSSV